MSGVEDETERRDKRANQSPNSRCLFNAIVSKWRFADQLIVDHSVDRLISLINKMNVRERVHVCIRASQRNTGEVFWTCGWHFDAEVDSILTSFVSAIETCINSTINSIQNSCFSSRQQFIRKRVLSYQIHLVQERRRTQNTTHSSRLKSLTTELEMRYSSCISLVHAIAVNWPIDE